MIPVYREENIILETCLFYRDLLIEADEWNLNLHFVGNTVEGNFSTNQTIIKVNEFFRTNSKVSTSIAQSGSKAGQLNYVLNSIIPASNVEDESQLIGIYDVDSRPSLASLIANFSLLEPNVVAQQYGCLLYTSPSPRDRG